MGKNLNSIRNKIRLFSPIALIINAIDKNFLISKLPPDKLQGFLPWELMLLIKWVFVFGDTKNRKIPTVNQMNSLINKVKALNDDQNKFLKMGMPGIRKFVRQLAFQQFHFQDRLNPKKLGRQIEIYLNSKSKYQFNKVFFELTGIGLEDFFLLSFMLWTAFHGEGRTFILERSWFDSVQKMFPDQTIEKFLNLLSVDYIGAKKLAETAHKKYGLELQIFEQSPFQNKPMLYFGGKYYVFSPDLLTAGLETFVYDSMKSHDSEKFCDGFGRAFEQYLQKYLGHFKNDFIPEREIKKIIHEQVVDFILPADSATVLVESKAVELGVIARMNPETTVMENALQSNVTKGVYQAFKVGSHITKNPNAFSKVVSKNFFVLIVSYKELYLGNGQDAWSEFLSSGLQKKYDLSSIGDFTVDPSRIFFLSVDDFENLIKISQGNNETIASILLKASEKNKNVNTAKFVFGQHLSEYSYDSSIKVPICEGHFENSFNRIVNHLQNSGQSTNKSDDFSKN